MTTKLKRGSVWSIKSVNPSQHGLENSGDVESCRRIFYPLLVSMAIVGLCHGDVVWGSSPKTRLKIIGRYVNKIYSICVLILVWILALKTFSSYSIDDKFGPSLLLKIGIHTWQLLCALNTLVCYRMCSKGGKLSLCVDNIVHQHANSCDYGKNTKSLRRIVKTCAALAWISVILIMTANIKSLDDFTIEATISPFPYDVTNSGSRFAAATLSVVFSLYQIVCYTFPSFLVCVMSMALYRLFGSVASKVGNEEVSNGSLSTNKTVDLECLRQQHQHLCHLVSDVDTIFSAYNASILLFGSGLILLLIYQLIWNNKMFLDTSDLIFLIMWIADGLVKIAVVSVGGALLNSKVNFTFYFT